MKRSLRYMGWAFAGLIILGGLGSAWWVRGERQRREEERAMEMWLLTEILPRFDLRDQKLGEAVAIFNKAIEAAPNHPPGLRIVAPSAEESMMLYRRAIAGSGMGRGEGPSDETLTITLSEIQLLEALRETAALTNRMYEIRGRTVVLSHRDWSRGTINPSITQQVRLAVGLSSDASGAGDGEVDFMKRLGAEGLVFYEGDFANYEPRTGRLRIRATQEQLDIIDLMKQPSPWDRRRDWLRYHLRDRWLGLPPPPPPLPAIPTIPGLDGGAR